MGSSESAKSRLLSLVLPIVLSDVWTLVIQGSFVTVAWVFLLMHWRKEGVKRPKLRVEGSWIVTTICVVGLAAALAVAVYARRSDDIWLGAAALTLNFVSYLVAYGGIRFLISRQLNRRLARIST